MSITRRHLLALGAASAAAAAVGATATAVHWWEQPAAAGYTQLSVDEAAFVRAWAAAAFPGGDTLALHGRDAGLDHFFDRLLTHLPAMQRSLLKLLLHALEASTLPLHGAPFSSLSEAEARRAFHRLSDHELAELRSAVSGLTVLLGMGYSTHPEVAPTLARWHRCGYG